MATDYTLPKAGEHVISFAYPISDVARRLGQSERGCFVVRLVGGATYAHATYSACVAHVEPLGTRPGRWSMDHAWNQQFLSPLHESDSVREWHQRLLAEEAQRVAAAAHTGAVLAQGGSVTIDLDPMPARTVVTETHRDAKGNGVAVRNAGELWGIR